MIETIAAFCVGLALMEFAAFLSVIFGYAIPRAPWPFRIALILPMLTSIFAIFSIGFIALSGEERAFTFDAIELLAIYFISQFFVWFIFVAYAFYHGMRRIRRRREVEVDTSEKMDEARAVATQRHEQYSDEHMRMLRQTRDAAIKTAALAIVEQDKLEEILLRLRDQEK